ncbi:hypothetical protein H0H92_013803, partial [Tricholoma furcatifolium]
MNIQHLFNISQALQPQQIPTDYISANVFNNFFKHGYINMNHLGHWSHQHPSPYPFFILHPAPLQAPFVIKRDWHLFQHWTSLLPEILSSLSNHDASLFKTPLCRQSEAEVFIVQAEKLAPRISPHTTPHNVYATDASMILQHEHPAVSFAVVAHGNAFVLSLRQFRG